MSAEVISLTERRLLRDGYEAVNADALAKVLCAGCGEWKSDVFQWTPEHGLRCQACAK